RPLRRAIERRVEDPLSEDILKGTFANVSLLRIEVKDGELAFVPQDAKEEEEQEAEPAIIGAGSDEAPEEDPKEE
ncbi:MAG: hypothetical protein O2857_26680, partial [Planctomycetota bacterium]|nr:hypothetical protein [Planctomycetota bacterium]